jgi:hypothetical protein
LLGGWASSAGRTADCSIERRPSVPTLLEWVSENVPGGLLLATLAAVCAVGAVFAGALVACRRLDKQED